MLETITGFVEHIVFRNEENGYTVLNLISEEDEITCVGNFPSISEGETICVDGSYTSHPSYGEQFKITSFEVKPPEDILSVERYLGSGAIKGIGVALAARIVRKFKKDTFRIIEEEPERLAEVKGISERKAREIAEQIGEKKDQREAMIFLQQYGISLALAVKIYRIYGEEIYSILKANPYKLADDVKGIGFKIADEIAVKGGIQIDSEFRIQSGIIYVLQQAATKGHTCLPEEELTKQAEELLQVAGEQITPHYMNLAMEKKLMIRQNKEKQYIYAAAYYYMEMNVAVMLKELDIVYDISDDEMEQRIQKIEKNTEMKLDDMQREAVKEGVKHGLTIVTGGPGTGKTTTVHTMIKYFETEGMDLFLAAPTGRAAKRMSEATGYEAKTIHRLLELNGDADGEAGFERNEQNPLETDVIIIDEMSMVDISLMYALLKAVAAGTRLILVGDASQLPSVGPGSVLKDMIGAKCFQVVHLKKIFRQAVQSDIIVNAHKINQGELVSLDNNSRDFFFLKRYEADAIIGVVIQLILQKLPKYVEADSLDIQVLTPMRKGLLGVERLNVILQQYLNPPSEDKKEKEYGKGLFRVGDKVMQIRNNYQMEWEIKNRYGIVVEKGLGIFNGDIGIIKSIQTYTETLTIEFDEGRVVEYSFKQLEELELAYAITIHKSQGSEYPAVILPLLNCPRPLMNRNLLYTAVTRAKRCVTVVGDETIFNEMIKNESEQKRFTGLGQRLIEE